MCNNPLGNFLIPYQKGLGVPLLSLLNDIPKINEVVYHFQNENKRISFSQNEQRQKPKKFVKFSQMLFISASPLH